MLIVMETKMMMMIKVEGGENFSLDGKSGCGYYSNCGVVVALTMMVTIR